MQKMSHIVFALGLALGGAAQAQAGTAADWRADFGSINTGTATGRVIEIGPETRSVNVDNGETVTIRHGAASFTWHVQAAGNVNLVPLSRVAPRSLGVPELPVYIAPGAPYLERLSTRALY